MTKLTTRKSTSTKLTDTQLIVLSRAVQREDGAATLLDGITEKAAQKLAATLVEKALVRKIRAKPDMPVRGTPSTRSMRRERPVRPPSPALSVDEISELASQICQCPIA